MERGSVEANGIEFEYLEAGDGDRLALCLHGFPDDAGSMEPIAERLSDAGFRCVAPWMRGYGPTDPAPDGDYSVPSLASDAVALADALDAGSDPILVGHDWGATAAYGVAAAAPDRFSELVALAVPPNFARGLREHPVQLLRSWYMLFFQLPALPEWALCADDFGLVEFLWGTWSPTWDYPDERIASVKDTFRQGDTVEHALAYYRHLRDSLADDDGAAPSGFDVPVLVAGGAEDGCIGPALFRDVEPGFATPGRVVVVDDAGHFLHQERPDVVCEEILSFVD
ncbi:MAG: alpha/beta fold hydrolase [Haloarculaceae archaeon]